MKQLLILSGKGGTGKTTVASAFIRISESKVFGDCDVDAPNLHLSLPIEGQANITDFFGMKKAHIHEALCTGCGDCFAHCKFDAIKKDGDKYQIDAYACEGCGVCEFVCPVGAVSMVDSKAGDLMLYNEGQHFSTAKLQMGSGNSGKLVAEVKKALKTDKDDLVIVDGSPGIGCPVIASMSGVDGVLLVTEPTISAFSDLERILETGKAFQLKMVVCINKYDINESMTAEIEAFCQHRQLSVVGKIPYDARILNALNNGRHIVEEDKALRAVFQTIYDNTIYEIYGG